MPHMFNHINLQRCCRCLLLLTRVSARVCIYLTACPRKARVRVFAESILRYINNVRALSPRVSECVWGVTQR